MGVTKTQMNAGQLLKIAGLGRSELVRGELIEMSPVGGPHSRIVVRLGSLLLNYVDHERLGEVGTERGFILAHDPDTVRAPDVHFTSQARLTSANQDGFFEGAPDLAVEVLSPDDRASEVLQKVREYFAAGAQLVWVADPVNRTVTVHSAAGYARVCSGSDEVTGEDVVPGFRFRVSDLFPKSAV